MRRKNLAHHVGSLDRQLGWQQKLRECRQITFVTLNGFCPLNPPTPLFLTDNIKMDRIPTKIKCKIHAPFILTKFYKTQLARYLVLIQTIQTVTKFYLQIAGKKLTATVFPLLLREARIWTILLTRQPKPPALVEKYRTSPLHYDFCRCAVHYVFKTVISEL